ncbi:MAG TPA: hypothetical protein VJY34_11165 [Roseiarcus sp.]|nr:hypothetical protein [Roseiarcus sp.]
MTGFRATGAENTLPLARRERPSAHITRRIAMRGAPAFLARSQGALIAPVSLVLRVA